MIKEFEEIIMKIVYFITGLLVLYALYIVVKSFFELSLKNPFGKTEWRK
jgi:uncharacterized membrane protein YuzA (DUF378 family)